MRWNCLFGWQDNNSTLVVLTTWCLGDSLSCFKVDPFMSKCCWRLTSFWIIKTKLDIIEEGNVLILHVIVWNLLLFDRSYNVLLFFLICWFICFPLFLYNIFCCFIWPDSHLHIVEALALLDTLHVLITNV